MPTPEQPTLNELEQFLKINMSELDNDLIQQPELLRQVSEAYALAVSRRDAAKEELERVNAELYSTIRSQAEEEGRKITEKAIDSEITQSPEHQRAHREWLDRKLEADQWSALKDSFYQRSHMLRDLVSLFTSGYFSDPSAVPKSEENHESPKEMMDKARREEEANKRRGRAEV